MARTGTGHILGDETDSVGALSGGLATGTDSVGTPASGEIATETDIMGRPAPGRSFCTEYTVYRSTHIDIVVRFEYGLQDIMYRPRSIRLGVAEGVRLSSDGVASVER